MNYSVTSNTYCILTLSQIKHFLSLPPHALNRQRTLYWSYTLTLEPFSQMNSKQRLENQVHKLEVLLHTFTRVLTFWKYSGSPVLSQSHNRNIINTPTHSMWLWQLSALFTSAQSDLTQTLPYRSWQGSPFNAEWFGHLCSQVHLCWVLFR